MSLPKHIAIILDGNGRWAKKRSMPRVAGHKAGVEAVRETIKACSEVGIEILTLFAFSSENWSRPKDEVNTLMSLFLSALTREIKKLHENNVRFKMIGNLDDLPKKLQRKMIESQQLTEKNTGMQLVVATNYGGRWDILQACKQLALKAINHECNVDELTEADVANHLSTAGIPEPDLLIRTSGEQRISNYLLWQLAYAELYFTDVLWPDFNKQELLEAIDFYQKRERRFGSTSEQL